MVADPSPSTIGNLLPSAVRGTISAMVVRSFVPFVMSRQARNHSNQTD